MGGLITYCMKGKSPGIKILSGVLYTYWINHFFTLGSQLGVLVHLPWALDQLNMGKNYSTGILL